MANEIYKAFMVGSQIVQIAQNARTNQHLSDLNQHQQNQAAAEQRLAWIRDQLFIVSRALEDAHRSLENNPVKAYYLCARNILFLRDQEVTSATFPTLEEKEYFHQIWTYAHDIGIAASTALTQEQIDETDKAVAFDYALPELRRFAAWKRIASLLPTIPIMSQWYRNWQLPYFRILSIVGGLIFPPLLIMAIITWATTPYRANLPTIRGLAKQAGGWVADHVTHKDAERLAAQHRQHLLRWSFQPPENLRDLDDYVTSLEQYKAGFSAQHLALAS